MTTWEQFKDHRRENREAVYLLQGKFDDKAKRRGLVVDEHPTEWKQAIDLAIKAKDEIYRNETHFELACEYFVDLTNGSEIGAYLCLRGKDYGR